MRPSVNRKKLFLWIMTLLDQMARGKCVIASRVSSLTDYAVDGDTVVFYEPENVEDCKEKFEKMLNNPKKRIRNWSKI